MHKRSIAIYGIAIVFLVATIYGMFAPKKYPSLWWKYIKENNVEEMSVLLTSKSVNLEEKNCWIYSIVVCLFPE